MSLFGPKAKKSSNSPKGMGGRSLTQQGNSPNKRGTPEEVAARDYEAIKGRKLHDELQKSKSTGLNP